MSARLPVCEDAAVGQRMREIQAERMAAIAGCACSQRDTTGEVVHAGGCPLRAPPAVLAREAMQRARARLVRGVAPVALAVALAYDPHLLLLTWSGERQEAVAATTRATCDAAVAAIRAGRWLADDPPVAMACRRGNGFAPGAECIENYNCKDRRP